MTKTSEQHFRELAGLDRPPRETVAELLSLVENARGMVREDVDAALDALERTLPHLADVDVLRDELSARAAVLGDDADLACQPVHSGERMPGFPREDQLHRAYRYRVEAAALYRAASIVASYRGKTT